ncbi:hypothetical protein BFW01_g1855 [Lasiodiplodia theobromae]|uniref:Uncharacterized protein n=1 Tax=Lasiodiplodia theobromae TaxID=45133 RepID=A0A8H7MCG0_9PEZI|nr:hypothetical protein BFW01_g1855 [Lasiodiplodia theobromae]
MSTQQGIPSSSRGAPFQLIDDVNGFSHEAFLNLAAAPFVSVQDLQPTTTLTDNYSTVDPLQNPMGHNSSAQLDWLSANLPPIPENGPQYQHNTGQLSTSNFNDAILGNAATSTDDVFMLLNDASTFNIQYQVEGNTGSDNPIEDFGESQLADTQAMSITSHEDFPYDDYLCFTPLETPGSTPAGTQSGHETDSVHFLSTPEDWDIVSSHGSLSPWIAIGRSEGNTPSDASVIAGSIPTSSDSVHGTSEMRSPSSHEERSVPESRVAPTIARQLLPAEKNPNASTVAASHPPHTPGHSMVPTNDAPVLQVTITRDWDSKVTASKRKQEEKAEESREQAKKVRKLGACVRCHMYKLKV